MYTHLLYQAERSRTAKEQRELNTINGELALALRRAFTGLSASRHAAHPVTRQPRASRQPSLRVAAFRSEATAPEARCN
jgi:hypothetical protein